MPWAVSPPGNAKKVEFLFLLFTNYYGLSVTEGTIAKGETFMLEAAVIYNMGSADYSGDMKDVLVNKNGNRKEDISENLFEEGDSIESGYGTGISGIECTINGDIAFGDRVAIWYLLSDGTWTPSNTTPPITTESGPSPAWT